MSELKITNNRGENKVAHSLVDALQKPKGLQVAEENPDVNVYNVQTDITDLIHHELENANTFGDKIGYFITPTVIPSPEGQPMPVVMVLIETKSVVLGQKAQVTTFIPADGDRRMIIRSTVSQLLDELQKAKDQIAKQSSPQ